MKTSTDQDLNHILQQVAPNGGLSLVKNFKSGSDAMTVLVEQDGKFIVKKIVPKELEHRLRNQYLWLHKHREHERVVRVLGEHRAENHYAIDIEYCEDNMPFFEYVHANSFEEAAAILDELWNYMFSRVYNLEEIRLHENERDSYIADRLEKKLEHASSANADLAAAMKGDKIRVNDEAFDNYHVVMRRIKNNKRAWEDVATFRASSAIHGDLTIDNILVDISVNKPLLIDPSDDNQIQGPVLDFGRHMQSLLYGYEFLNTDNEPVQLTRDNGMVAINFQDQRSSQYEQLHNHVVNEIMPKYLEEAERRAVLFHVGLFYGRVLAHRVTINPDNVLKFYGTSIKALNKFIEQYE